MTLNGSPVEWSIIEWNVKFCLFGAHNWPNAERKRRLHTKWMIHICCLKVARSRLIYQHIEQRLCETSAENKRGNETQLKPICLSAINWIQWNADTKETESNESHAQAHTHAHTCINIPATGRGFAEFHQNENKSSIYVYTSIRIRGQSV